MHAGQQSRPDMSLHVSRMRWDGGLGEDSLRRMGKGCPGCHCPRDDGVLGVSLLR